MSVKKAVRMLREATSMGGAMAALLIPQTKEEAAALVDTYAALIVEDEGCEFSEAFARIKRNVGYMSGYYDPETAARLLDIYETEHPFFGRRHVDGTLTPEEAFELGKRQGERMRAKREEERNGG